MKLGTETNSLQNHIYSRMTKDAPAPEEGMAATLLHWTDRSAATVACVTKLGQVILVREDRVEIVAGSTMSESQEWRTTPNPDGALHWFRKRKDGGWQEVRVNPDTGRLKAVEGGCGLILGFRDHYRDPSF